MKKLIFNLILSLIILSISGCKQDNAPVPLKFKGYEGNPVLVPGEPGSWDDMYVINAFEIKDEGTVYLFYTAYSQKGTRSLGVATSTDGKHFIKFESNPILVGDKMGFDAFGVAQAHILREDSLWVLYYNGREIAGFSSGPFIGRATSKSLKGPWIRREYPVLTTGRRGEWDSDFVYLGPVLKTNDGTYKMYYAAGDDLISQYNFYIGLATSSDGIHWKKYNDPTTVDHPFADSDPVLMTGKPGEWDDGSVLTGTILEHPYGFEMYYAGAKIFKSPGEVNQVESIGYASSPDGIHWKKYRKNPIYRLEDDPLSIKFEKYSAVIQGPKLLFMDSQCFMYYDYGHSIHSGISMAFAELR